jgi:superfamily II DNA or RNA helicase
MTTPFHARFWATDLRLQRSPENAAGLHSLSNARVDLNPHQVDAALFALRSPYSKGVLLADEVGLGKTIEASLVLAQRWAERKRRILLIVPATLRKQWQTELAEKFFLPSVILESKTANAKVKQGLENPFLPEDEIIIASYQFVFTKRALVQNILWDLVVIDEAHRLRSIYKETKTAKGIVEAIGTAPKLLLTATPLQNSLLELYGLVSIVDPKLFGTKHAFEAQYVGSEEAPEQRDAHLRERLEHVCKRTLRRQVHEYVSFTKRFAQTAEFYPNPDEEKLYLEVSKYLQRNKLAALPNTRRKLITMIMRKLLASSPAAIGATLETFAKRLRETAGDAPLADDHLAVVADDFELAEEVEEEWEEEDDDEGEAQPRPRARVVPRPPASAPSDSGEPDPGVELGDLERFIALAASIQRDAKVDALVKVLPTAFELATQKGAAKKAVIFTESVKTQSYLAEILTQQGYGGQIALMNGSNNDSGSRQIYEAWKKRHAANWTEVSSRSKTADMKAAIVEEFRERATILIATESAAEGVNLQFCSIVVNYDLPWNPQRVEQRIGRCHRYGQKCDVLVVNFLNKKNEADQRVLELLTQKFQLFEGIFGASDAVLGALESGVDLEKRIAEIYQECRSTAEIATAFNALQTELEEKISAGLESARRAFLEHFDADVHARLRVHRDEAKATLDEQHRTLLDLMRHHLRDSAHFDPMEPRFVHEGTSYHLDWKQADVRGDVFLRLDHPLSKRALDAATTGDLPAENHVVFDYEPHASALQAYVGQSGWLDVVKLTVTAIDRREESLVLVACDDLGLPLAPEAANRFFSLRATPKAVANAPPPHVAALREERITAQRGSLDVRNQLFFDEESEKIDRWADDRKLSLERELKVFDGKIREAKKSARAAKLLEQKVAAQKAVRSLEHQREEKRRELEKTHDEVERQRGELIEKAEAQLKSESQIEPIFTLRWTLRGQGS